MRSSSLAACFTAPSALSAELQPSLFSIVEGDRTGIFRGSLASSQGG